MGQNETDMQELAAQLRCPTGERGLIIARNMDFTNANIISKTIDSLNLEDNDKVLEIGPGNAAHVYKILEKAHGIQYYGADISETMVAEAKRLNEGRTNVLFCLTDGESLPFEKESFTKIFTTNTIYFWANPAGYVAELSGVLKPGGLLSVGFIPKRIMQHIPFSKYGFTLYEEAAVKELLEKSGFEVIAEIAGKETIAGPDGEGIEREFAITTGRKL